ncbi:exosortase family protein XrtF [uncultured Christiangramia sp.]|uniref:exosortase family protein XrtF n=1 Tax=uncultured Christiangramia sp. TaxID=503836 RepID=UPI0025E0EFA7|nr:exosortase family protein XrtF [uncultured Christiangramia sp.]
MLKLIKKYRTVLRFIFVFLGSYFLFSSAYNAFLLFYEQTQPVPDALTRLVAYQSGDVMHALGYDNVKVVMHYTGLSMKLMVEGYFLAGIVEGCNSASIIILFTSFILAFFGKTSTTLIYIFAGAALIYATNILRIVILSVSILEYPQYSGFMHTVFFPLAIYGMVFLLWLVWIRIFTKYKKA